MIFQMGCRLFIFTVTLCLAPDVTDFGFMAIHSRLLSDWAIRWLLNRNSETAALS